ncbi:hypothetical protein AB0M95_01295 [Sphaerisporangium sp. NPDC051017]|uniref:hypothetical protein n=1 Tax=Sphaerisporangium sp. NPDC051017 TaxID=3154636 RepID=UPI003427D39B
MRQLLLVPPAMCSMATVIMILSVEWGFALLVLGVLFGFGLGLVAVHNATVERDRREQGALEGGRSVWAAAGRWLARH